jgi:hypothetical protein
VLTVRCAEDEGVPVLEAAAPPFQGVV